MAAMQVKRPELGTSIYIKKYLSLAAVGHAFNPSTKQKQVDLCELEDSLVYRASSKTARAAQRNCLNKQRNKEANKQKCL